MSVTRRMTPLRSHVRLPAGLLALALAAALALPATALGSVLPAWGSSLAATPNYDTANGDYTPSAGPGFTDRNPTPGSRRALLNPGNPGDPSFHGGDDVAVWNAASADTAPAGGQVLEIKLKGCAWNDPIAPGYPDSEQSAGVPVNQVNFQTLAPNGSGYTPAATAAGFRLPFCSNSSNPSDPNAAVNTSTVTTYQPIHMCVAAGDAVAFADIGGYIPATGSYPNGVPFLIMAGNGAAAPGSVLNSYVHVNGGAYSTSSPNFASEPNEELMLQVIEGTGDDAYGLCPGGIADEPLNSNTIICVERHVNPGDPYPACDRNGNPLWPPGNVSLPTLSGTPQEGKRLVEAHGRWTGSPYGYRVQWVDCDTTGANCTPIPGATYQFYYPTSADVGHTLEVQEWASNDANTAGPVSTPPTPVIVSATAPTPLGFGAPQIWGVWVKAARRATVVNYTDNQFATATLRVLTLVPGVKRGRSCVAAPKNLHPRARKRCQKQVVVKRLTHNDRAGSNAVKLVGLKPGHYSIEIKAQIGGQTGEPAVMPFVARDVTSRGHAARRRRH